MSPIPCDILEREHAKFGETVDGKTAVRVLLYPGENGEPIPVYFVETPGDEQVYPVRLTTTPGTEVSMISLTVPALKKWYLSRLELSCRVDAIFNIYVNAAWIGAKRSASGAPNASFSFSPREPISSGDTIEITVEAAPYVPASSADLTLMLIEQGA
jgi:hypothetical protein